MSNREYLPPFSRRTFLNLSLAASAAAAAGTVFSEGLLAQAARGEHRPLPKDAVAIDSNENPLGPGSAARQAIAAVIPNGGRYSFWMTDELLQTFADQEGLPLDHVAVYPGSSEPLHDCVMAFTSPAKSYVTADPGYEAGMTSSKNSGARVVKVPLARDYSHDVKAMVSATPDAGLIYICTPNNPTGTLTSHADVEYAVEHKPADSIVLVDEAYIHFSDASSCIDLVKAGKDVIVLRTFSKIYGMAGLRCGFAIGRPGLLEKIYRVAGWNAMPITAVAAATASLKDPDLVAERKRINTANREAVFAWLRSNSYSFVPSQSNCFMLDTKRDGKQVIEAMRQQNVYIGRIWPVMPTYVRITVGTQPEMERFQLAYQNVMKGTVMSKSTVAPKVSLNHLDGLRPRGIRQG
jgi:histidinol-phosphate aminotransferase